MKRKIARKVSTLVCVAALVLCCSGAVFATSGLPAEVNRATPNSATVSDKKDVATNKDPDMSTQFYMFMEPDLVVVDYPKMGDEGLDVSLLMWAALLAGTAYLGVSAYADSPVQKHAA